MTSEKPEAPPEDPNLAEEISDEDLEHVTGGAGTLPDGSVTNATTNVKLKPADKLIKKET